MKYGFIGCGNMGGAIAKAVSQVTKDIMVSDRSGKARPLPTSWDWPTALRRRLQQNVTGSSSVSSPT